MKTNTVVIINGSYGNQMSDLKDSLTWGFHYLNIEPDFFYSMVDIHGLNKYEYLIYISLNGFEEEKYDELKMNFKDSIFLSNEILQKENMYEFFNKLPDFYKKSSMKQKNIELRLKNLNYQTDYKKVNNIQKLLSEKKIPFSVSIQEITEKNDEKIPINRNKKLIEELYNGNYKISNEYSDKQMIIDITNSKEINNLFYLDYLKNYDILVEVSPDMKKEDIYKIIEILENENVSFSVTQKTESLKINNIEYSVIKRNSGYFSILLIFVVVFFALIFYRLYRNSRKTLFKRRIS